MAENDVATADPAGADAAFSEAFGESEPKATVTETPAAETPKVETPKPEFVQITKADLAKWEAAAAEVTALKHTQAKSFGTFGKTIDGLKAVIEELRTRAKTDETKLTSAAFDKLKEQFPELADMTREAVQNALSGATDETKIRALLDEHAVKLTSKMTDAALEDLNDAHPDWRTIVGAPTTPDGSPNLEVPFRAWLATKDDGYQKLISGTENPRILERSIDRFRRETKTQAKPAQTARAEQRREQIAAAVTSRGDGASARSSQPTAEDAFLAAST